ncbi:hypothetical protein K7X08_035782 [Anisodus acutangulus]|uniref:Uncharacterized protein n=1 Tax=Anisodus acutangulus TaxID=402998 RepID=A0A9Q1LWX5_9SOLA|nr:hypothetical protein K7X08_035782 [Anisodus acutangulus]
MQSSSEKITLIYLKHIKSGASTVFLLQGFRILPSQYFIKTHTSEDSQLQSSPHKPISSSPYIVVFFNLIDGLDRGVGHQERELWLS